MRIAANPRLYDAASDDPALTGTECDHCNRVYFPPMDIGCEICGAPAEQLLSRSLATTGVVHAVAEVFLSPGKTPTPFTIAEIVLDEGPLVRALIHPDSADVRIGERVEGRWSVTERTANGDELVEPRFTSTANANGVGE